MHDAETAVVRNIRVTDTSVGAIMHRQLRRFTELGAPYDLNWAPRHKQDQRKEIVQLNKTH